MKTLLALLVILCAGGYYLYTLREENSKMKGEVDKMSGMLSDEDRAKLGNGTGGAVPPSGPAHKRIVCPVCKGEGFVMGRRTLNDNIVDVKTPCVMCMGRGKREIDLPKGAEICP